MVRKGDAAFGVGRGGGEGAVPVVGDVDRHGEGGAVIIHAGGGRLRHHLGDGVGVGAQDSVPVALAGFIQPVLDGGKGDGRPFAVFGGGSGAGADHRGLAVHLLGHPEGELPGGHILAGEELRPLGGPASRCLIDVAEHRRFPFRQGFPVPGIGHLGGKAGGFPLGHPPGRHRHGPGAAVIGHPGGGSFHLGDGVGVGPHPGDGDGGKVDGPIGGVGAGAHHLVVFIPDLKPELPRGQVLVHQHLGGLRGHLGFQGGVGHRHGVPAGDVVRRLRHLQEPLPLPQEVDAAAGGLGVLHRVAGGGGAFHHHILHKVEEVLRHGPAVFIGGDSVRHRGLGQIGRRARSRFKGPVDGERRPGDGAIALPGNLVDFQVPVGHQAQVLGHIGLVRGPEVEPLRGQAAAFPVPEGDGGEVVVGLLPWGNIAGGLGDTAAGGFGHRAEFPCHRFLRGLGGDEIGIGGGPGEQGGVQLIGVGARVLLPCQISAQMVLGDSPARRQPLKEELTLFEPQPANFDFVGVRVPGPRHHKGGHGGAAGAVPAGDLVGVGVQLDLEVLHQVLDDGVAQKVAGGFPFILDTVVVFVDPDVAPHRHQGGQEGGGNGIGAHELIDGGGLALFLIRLVALVEADEVIDGVEIGHIFQLCFGVLRGPGFIFHRQGIPGGQGAAVRQHQEGGDVGAPAVAGVPVPRQLTGRIPVRPKVLLIHCGHGGFVGVVGGFPGVEPQIVVLYLVPVRQHPEA